MCDFNEKKVKWTIPLDFLNKIKKSLLKDKYEVAGTLLFKNYNCIGENLCDKTLSDFILNKGDGDSVYTPYGIINYHTHPRKCYKDEQAYYGWPSGEDISACIDFAKENNLVHIVFSLEGAYVINVINIPNQRETDIIEKVLKETHVFRSEDQDVQLKNFTEFCGYEDTDTCDMWLNLINAMTPKLACKLYNANVRKIKISNNDNKLFNVKLLPYDGSITFNAYYVDDECHSKSFYGK